MSRFLSQKHQELEPYTPGEQPRDAQYTKLNTNESPFPPSQAVVEAAAREAGRLNLYCDPECTDLRQKAAALYGLKPENILPVNGSDEILYFAFMAFCDETHPVAFPDISYGFYPVYAAIHHVPAHIIPLKEDFSIDYRDYCGLNQTIVIANPNAPTGMALKPQQIEEILRTNPNNVVVIDEAYVDFGGQSCVPLIQKYDNLLVTQTFSKSRSLAGARLGFGLGCETLIQDLNTIKYSTNPYNINRMTQAAGIAAIETDDYYQKNCQTIIENRAYTTAALETMGFQVLPSCSNFLFAQSDRISGKALYQRLKERGVLVRHFDKERIGNFVRITVGTRAQMDILLMTIESILQQEGLDQ
jgi:histidinol-phosphate aminotransferase